MVIRIGASCKGLPALGRSQQFSLGVFAPQPERVEGHHPKQLPQF